MFYLKIPAKYPPDPPIDFLQFRPCFIVSVFSVPTVAYSGLLKYDRRGYCSLLVVSSLCRLCLFYLLPCAPKLR